MKFSFRQSISALVFVVLSSALRSAPVLTSGSLVGHIADQINGYPIKASGIYTDTVWTAVGHPLFVIRGRPVQQVPVAQLIPNLNFVNGVFTGTPSVVGRFILVITATNRDGSKGSCNYFVTIMPPQVPVIPNQTFTVTTTGNGFDYQIPHPNVATTFADLSPGVLEGVGMAFDASTGTISGTPQTDTNTTLSVTLSAKNAGGTGVGTLTLVIVAPPKWIGALPAGKVGVSYNAAPGYSNSPDYLWCYNPDAPTTLGLGNEGEDTRGTITGTPTKSGQVVMRYVAYNAAGESTTDVDKVPLVIESR